MNEENERLRDRVKQIERQVRASSNVEHIQRVVICYILVASRYCAVKQKSRHSKY